MKIAISSDNHLDVNRINSGRARDFQAEWLRNHNFDYYFHLGDLFNNLRKTQHYMDHLQQLLPSTKVFYIAGNHEMINDAPYTELENSLDPRYLHNRFIDIPGTDWRVIANNGWYDYSFSSYNNDPDAVRSWKKVYWLDSSADQPMTDQERMAIVLKQVQKQLKAAKQANKEVMFMTHFAPRRELLAPKPSAVNTPRRERVYQMIQTFMGSEKLGELLESYPNVKSVFYGHLHGIHPPFTHNGVTYFNQAVGVANKRVNEWQYATFEDQWRWTLYTTDV